MRESDPGSAREEAERLVAAVIAAASAASRQGSGAGPLGSLGSLGSLGEAVFSVAGQVGSAVRGVSARVGGAAGHTDDEPGHAGAGAAWATGSAECCVCPICRVITALRDPSPEVAERLSTGAGDFAAGIASLLRAVSAAAAATRPGGRPSTVRAAQPVPRAAGPDDTAWRAATRAGNEPGSSATEPDPWALATADADQPAAPDAAPDGPAAAKRGTDP